MSLSNVLSPLNKQKIPRLISWWLLHHHHPTTQHTPTTDQANTKTTLNLAYQLSPPVSQLVVHGDGIVSSSCANGGNGLPSKPIFLHNISSLFLTLSHPRTLRAQTPFSRVGISTEKAG